MRISPMLRMYSGFLFTLLILIAGCSNPSSQTLDSLTITATPSTLSVGGAAILHAKAHLSDGTTQDVTSGTQWTLSDSSLATVSNGALTAKAVGTLTVQAAYVEVAPAGTSPAAATTSPVKLSGSTQVTIAPAGSSNTPTITWNAPAAIPYGTALSATQLNATANVAGTFTYTPAAGTVLPVGTQTLSLAFAPSDTKTYSAATATVALTVTQATPVITWPTPAPVAKGTALSPAQLNATASVPGSFSYTPPAGTIVQAGNVQLTAAFTPTDTTNYAPATAQNTLTVTGGPVGGPIGPIPLGCGGPTINVNSGMSQSTLQSTISSAPTCAQVVFAAGNYNITAPITLKCSVTYTGPSANPATAVLSSNMGKANAIFNLYAASCPQTTTIAYLNFMNSGGIYVQASFSNLVITHNQFGNLPCCNTSTNSPVPGTVGVFFDGGSDNSRVVSNTSITWNSFGDSTSCTTPDNGMTEYGNTETFQGACAGIATFSSINGLDIENNVIGPVGEGVHINCYGNNCQPTQNPPGPIISNVTAQFNDFVGIRRIAWEEQPQATSNVVFQYNSLHDAINPYYGNFALSLACCSSGATSPGVVVANNVLIQNTPPHGRYGYGIEAWGLGGQYNYNLIQGLSSSQGIAWCYGMATGAVSYNVVQGPNYSSGSVGHGGDGFIGNEGTNGGCSMGSPSTVTGNVKGSTPSAIVSVAPTITFTGSGTVTITDPGYTSGAHPQGNTSIYYTTDGSTPTVNSTLYTGPITLSGAATVKAIGMWGSGANPKSYPAGYGFVPSAVVSASSTTAVAPAPAAKVRPASSASEGSGSVATEAGLPGNSAGAATLESVSITPSQPVVAIGSTTQLKALATFSDGSVRDVTAEFGWTSSDARTIGATTSGVLSGIASGEATITGAYQGHPASAAATSAIGAVKWSGPIVITQAGTYSGNWQSTDSNTPAVTVATTAPVIIENSHIRSVANLITATVSGSDLTVRNSLGVAAASATKGQPNGIFLEVASPVRLDVENNYIENARSGVLVRGYSGNRDGQQTIVIRANRARNLNGLLSNGNGGYLPGEGSNRSVSRFIELDNVQSVPGIDVGWNEVINYPGHSLVADNINVYRSSGTLNRPLEIHDTYIQGAYPYNAAQDAYTGGGIKTDGGSDDTAKNASAFNSIHDNQVVGTVNYGIELAAGHDNIASNNRVISSGLLADGTRIAAQHVGIANRDIYGTNLANGSMYNNTVRDNLVGWTCWSTTCSQQGYRKDQHLPAAPADYSNNSVLPAAPITIGTEENEYQVWQNKIGSAGITVGPAF